MGRNSFAMILELDKSFAVDCSLMQCCEINADGKKHNSLLDDLVYIIDFILHYFGELFEHDLNRQSLLSLSQMFVDLKIPLNFS